MEYNNFLETVKREVQIQMGELFEISLTHVSKNNGICLDGIIVTKKGQEISPAIYLNDQYYAYREGKKMKDIIKEIELTYYASRPEIKVDLEFFKSYREMKGRVLFKLIHYHKNKELLKEVPYMSFFDLAMVFYCDVSVQFGGNGTILIYNNHLKMWGIELEELYQDAMANMPREYPAEIQTMEEVMKELMVHNLQKKLGADVEVAELIDGLFEQETAIDKNLKQSDERYKMYVLSNSERLYGAGAMLYPHMLQSFADRLHTNVYLLPSSIHEVILIPDDGCQSKEELLTMVSEINDTQVDPEEVLAYAVYYFERKNGEITLL